MFPVSTQEPNGPAETNHTLLVGDRQRPCIEIPTKEYELRPFLGAEASADAELQISGRFIIIRSLASYLTVNPVLII